jgi:lauroyl/myristoyl acyltransferase
MIRVHALIPAFNEADTIAAVVRGVAPHVAAVTVIDDGSTDATRAAARDAGADVVAIERKGGKGAAVRAGLARALAGGCTHVLLLDGDLQHLPEEAPGLIAEAERTGADVVLGVRRFDRSAMPASRYHANRIGSLVLSRFMGVRVGDTQCGFRVFRADALRGLRLSAVGYEIETEMLVKIGRRGGRIMTTPVTAVYAGQRSKLRPVRDTTKTCFLAVYYRFVERDVENGAGPQRGTGVLGAYGDPSPESPADRLMSPVPRRWTAHSLNSGGIFAATYHGVRILPRAVAYAIGHVGAWIAWRAMPRSTDAVADNLRAVFPGESDRALRRRALDVYRRYTRDAIDFLRAMSADEADARRMFEIAPEYLAELQALHALGKGIILVTGHHGNWEVGGVLMSRLLHLPLTVVVMRESSAEVNRIRQEIRTRLGVETLEVRQSLDTPLQIRRHLRDGRFVAMLVDRHFGRDRVEVSFLGRPTWFLRTPIQLARLTGAPLVPCFIHRTGPGRFAVRPGKPIAIDAGQPRDAAIQAAAQQFADQLADEVRALPECWYHFYRYWDAQHDDYTGLA